jgi:hypothetical protein
MWKDVLMVRYATPERKPAEITYTIGLIEDYTETEDVIRRYNPLWEVERNEYVILEDGGKAEIIWETDEDRLRDYGDKNAKIKLTYRGGDEEDIYVKIYKEEIYPIDTSAKDKTPLELGYHKDWGK